MKAAQAEAISQLGAFGPQVIVLIGFVDDGIAFMKAAADKGMKTFVLTDGLKSDEVLNQLSADHEDVLCEVVGTNPANPEGKAYAIFEISFKSKYGEPPGAFTAHAYDALYALAYAAAAANKKPGTLTGMDFAAGLMRLTGGGTVIPVGTGKWTEGAALLHNDSGVAIDFEGASGKLEFDNDKGEPKTTAIEGWFFDTEKKQVQSLGVILTDGGEYKTPAGLPVCGGAESPL